MRRLAFGSIVLVLVTFSWGNRGVGQQVPVPRGNCGLWIEIPGTLHGLPIMSSNTS
jgi:hypothetical protein